MREIRPPVDLVRNIGTHQAFMFILFYEKENEPKEIARCDAALTGFPALYESLRALWNLA